MKILESFKENLVLLGGKGGSKGQDEDANEDKGACGASISAKVCFQREKLGELRDHVGGFDSNINWGHLELYNRGKMCAVNDIVGIERKEVVNKRNCR